MLLSSGSRRRKWLFIASLIISIGVVFGCTLVTGRQPEGESGERTPEETTHNVTQVVPSPTTADARQVKPTENFSTKPPSPSTATPPPKPTPTTAPVLFPLTHDGCCVQPFWAPDSGKVLFLDKPIASLPAGIWGIGLDGGVPELFRHEIGLFSPQMSFRAFFEKGATWVESIQDGQLWQIPNYGRQVYFSMDETRLAWSKSVGSGALREVWVSRVDGSQAHTVYSSNGAGLVGWLGSKGLLIIERSSGDYNQELKVLNLDEQQEENIQVRVLAQGFRFGSPLASPEGGWIAYYSVFNQDPKENGLWLANTQTGEKRRLPLFGAYRWRDEGRLLVIPLEMDQPTHHLWQVEAKTGSVAPLTDPAVTPFKVGGGDWQASPDGRWIVFVSANDNNIWVMKLP